ncbi:MAG: phospholipase D-like domain-containing protein, partial [Flavobacteriales bacterium]
ISDAYHGTTDQAPWLDFALWIEGEEAARIHKDCAMLWQGPRGRRLRKNKNDGPNVTENTAIAVRSVRNDFLRNRNEITATYRTAIRSAVKTIDLVGGYFLPGRRMRRYLKSATKRGVRIRIVAASRSDVLLARLSREYLYSWLLRNRIEVYEYLPANVHGKVLSVDGSLTSIGSYDLNNLSTYSNIEMNVNVLDRTVNEGFTEIYEETIRLHCRKVEETDWKRNTTLPGKFARWCAYRITKSLFGISFLIAGQSER